MHIPKAFFFHSVAIFSLNLNQGHTGLHLAMPQIRDSREKAGVMSIDRIPQISNTRILKCERIMHPASLGASVTSMRKPCHSHEAHGTWLNYTFSNYNSQAHLLVGTKRLGVTCIWFWTKLHFLSVRTLSQGSNCQEEKHFVCFIDHINYSIGRIAGFELILNQ